ncbi:MAG: ABC transporter ATP-binding protein [Candidatus Bathyarchaeia archaeon]
MARVVVEGLTKRFGALEAVKDLDLEVKDKEFVCILGPSGCGKTTTLRMIAGLEKQDEGDIYIGDRKVNDLSPPERDIAMVFQFYAIYPGMTVYDNLAFPLKQRKMSKPDIERKVKETAEMLRIDDILNKDAISLTAGEKQRIALGRAFVRSPQVFLLDEPLTNLDAGLRAIMRVELKRLQKEIGQTMIYVTHDQLEGMTMADRIAVMKSGLLQQYDTPDNLFNRPSNLFVANFVGSPSMNFLECSYEEEGERAKLIFDSYSIDVTRLRDHFRRGGAGKDLILGIRPTDVAILKEKGRDSLIEGKVDVVELVGDGIIVDVGLGKDIVRAIVPRRFPIKVDEKVWLRFDIDRLHLFDKQTEKAII